MAFSVDILPDICDAVGAWQDVYITESAFSFMGIVDPYKAIMARDKFVHMVESEWALVHRAPMQATTQRAFGLGR